MNTRSGRAIMFQGTASHVGKSVVAAAFCRLLKQDGYRVAPFKSQNMSNNSCITHEGGEIGRAQWVQAEAAGLLPSVIMNPVLIKPTADVTAQVVLLGRPAGNFEAGQYRREFTRRAVPVIQDCLDRLLAGFDAVVIEGAGSPAEINLKDGDIVNMKIAEMADSPVVLVADIDRGGVFASIVGTLELLEPDERDRVVGFIINKFRGSRELLQPGLDWLEQRTGKPVLGVLPYIHDHDIPDEDAVVLESRERLHESNGRSPGIRLAVVQLPRISNFTDIDPLSVEGVSITWATSPQDLDGADCIIIPGTKNTITDLEWMRSVGIADTIVMAAGRVPVIGICGGFQMLGKVLDDPDRTESRTGSCAGLGLLDVSTTFGVEKTTTWSLGEIVSESLVMPGPGQAARGYEIHTGVTTLGAGARPFMRVTSRDGVDTTGSAGVLDGAISPDGLVTGTYFHGLFDNAAVRTALVQALWQRKGLTAPLPSAIGDHSPAEARREAAYERLAAVVRANCDVDRVYRIMGLRA